MRINVKNLGMIQDADIDLKPLTIFIGPNNSGKTWLAYTIAGILSFNGYLAYLKAYIEDEDEEKYPLLEETLKNFIETGNATFDLIQFIEENGERYFNNLARIVGCSLQDFMGTGHVDFTDLKIIVQLAAQKSELLSQIKHMQIDRSFPRQQPLIKARKDSHEQKIYFYLPGEDISNVSALVPLEESNGDFEAASALIPEKVIREFICSVIFQHIHKALYPATHVFPTERTTFVTLPFGQNFELELHSPVNELEDELKSQGIKRASGPISDFLTLMLRLHMMNISARVPLRRKNKLALLAQILETEILQGKVDFSPQKSSDSHEILFYPLSSPEKSIALEMSVVSSMVKELSPLVLYLRFFAQKGDLLVIDEPEMNLHPRAQVQILEF